MRPDSRQRHRLVAATAIVAGLLIGFFGFIAVAQTPQTPGQIPAELIGVGVFSADGVEVGTVSAVTITPDGHISEIRFTTSSHLALGGRTVAVQPDRFVALTGAVVLEMSTDEVNSLPAQITLRGLAA